MKTASLENELQTPSRLVAEALVMRQNPDVVKARAKEMGLCENLTEAVVSVCCREAKLLEQGSPELPS